MSISERSFRQFAFSSAERVALVSGIVWSSAWGPLGCSVDIIGDIVCWCGGLLYSSIEGVFLLCKDCGCIATVVGLGLVRLGVVVLRFLAARGSFDRNGSVLIR